MVTKTDLTSAGVSRFRTAKAVSEGSQWPVSTWVTTPGEEPGTAQKKTRFDTEWLRNKKKCSYMLVMRREKRLENLFELS